MNNKGTRDREYFQIIFTASVFVIFYFGADYSGYSGWIKYGLSGVGAIVGFWAAQLVRSKPLSIKIAVLIISLLAPSGIFYVLSTARSNESYTELEYSANSELKGVWVSNDSDDLIIRFRFSGNDVFLGMSPEYEETKYRMEIKDDFIRLYEDSEVKFEWAFNILNEKEIELEADGERLRLNKVDGS